MRPSRSVSIDSVSRVQRDVGVGMLPSAGAGLLWLSRWFGGQTKLRADVRADSFDGSDWVCSAGIAWGVGDVGGPLGRTTEALPNELSPVGAPLLLGEDPPECPLQVGGLDGQQQGVDLLDADVFDQPGDHPQACHAQ